MVSMTYWCKLEARCTCRVQELRQMEQELRQRSLDTGDADVLGSVMTRSCLVKMCVHDATQLKAAVNWIFQMNQTARATLSRVHSSEIVRVCVSTTVDMAVTDAEWS